MDNLHLGIRRHFVVDVIIPAYNEAASIAKVVAEIPKSLVRHILVCDNASTDQTAINAREAGAQIVSAPIPGYGNACLAGINFLTKLEEKPTVVVFLDGDYSDYPGEMDRLLKPIMDDGFDMVIGSRALGKKEHGSMMPQQIFGNWLATTLIRWIYGYKFTDLGPFRAVTWKALESLHMNDKTYGWTVEMQVKAAKLGLKCKEVPVSYRVRIGQSKVSGTIKGTMMAGYKILWTIFKYIRR